ncbi:MAG TPA: hypothetical protein VFI84_00005, partial [Candidatus Saccharimonadales bacterium]|nr:hypothetical protein [Candidatus Saccharimonadales bacterium]
MAEKWTNRIRNNKGTLAKTGLAAVAAGSAIAAYEYSLHQQLESETDAIKFLERKLQPHYRDMLAVCAQLAVKGCLISPT